METFLQVTQTDFEPLCQARACDTPPPTTFPETSSVHPALEENKYTVAKTLRPSYPVFIPEKDGVRKSQKLLLSEEEEDSRPYPG